MSCLYMEPIPGRVEEPMPPAPEPSPSQPTPKPKPKAAAAATPAGASGSGTAATGPARQELKGLSYTILRPADLTSCNTIQEKVTVSINYWLVNVDLPVGTLGSQLEKALRADLTLALQLLESFETL